MLGGVNVRSVQRVCGAIALLLGAGCGAAVFVGVSRCCSGSAATSPSPPAETLHDLVGYSPFIALQAIPLVAYWRIHHSFRWSLITAGLIVAALVWIYWFHPFAMRTPSPLLGFWYVYAAVFLGVAQFPAIVDRPGALANAGRLPPPP